MKAIAATAIFAFVGAAQTQTGAYNAAALNDRAAVAYDAGDTVMAAVLWRLSGKAGSADAMVSYAALREAGYAVLDCQFMTGHLASLGAIPIPQSEYLDRLQNARGAQRLTLPQSLAEVEREAQDSSSSPGKLIAHSLTQTS